MNASVTGVILSGGRGRRMGGVDKGLQRFQGRSMIEWVLDRIEPQVDEVLISANQNLDHYLAFGHPVLHDRIPGFAGPLAGLHAALLTSSSELVVTVPCDSPFLPRDLVPRLAAELGDAQVAVAHTGDRRQSVFCMCRSELAGHLAAFLAGGGRQVEAWHASLRTVEVDFGDQADGFRNINTVEELQALNQGERLQDL